ncbi:hypothetical protein [Spiroplasma endosymbiont of Poecilobothrus nobilitatus]|uniref:hypothetical protein n=1 Tax=Spiroplasma endosymbiont of Poecilobothrus nobilitatus TaxID=1209220 RepID=UPI00313EC6A3
MRNKKISTAELISKYFDEVVTSSGIDPHKRPDVALQWAREKELWTQEADAIVQKQLLQALANNNKIQIHQVQRQQELALRDLQQIRLNELKKREEYLATLSKPVKLPKINKKILNSEVAGLELQAKPVFKNRNDINNVSTAEDNYGSIFMREICRALLDEYNMYHQPQEQESSLLSTEKSIKSKRQRYLHKKGPKSRW